LAGTGSQLRILAERGALRSQPGTAHARPHPRTLPDRQRHADAADQPDHRCWLPDGGDAEPGDAEQFCGNLSHHVLVRAEPLILAAFALDPLR
jgi:hypothetical protein